MQSSQIERVLIICAEWLENMWISLLQIKVLFADYGNYDFIEPEMIRPLKKKYKTLPLQAVRAGLYGELL